MADITNFPNGISSEGLRYRAGTLATTTGGTVDTGLTSVSYVVASLATAGTGSAYAAARPSTGGSAIITCHIPAGGAATVAGTVHWAAFGS